MVSNCIARWRAHQKKQGAQRQKLPDKPTNFQVRVHVLEARKLVGSDSMNPVVKVSCGVDNKQTSTQKGTNNPVFDEVSTCSTTVNCMHVHTHAFTVVSRKRAHGRCTLPKRGGGPT